MEFSAYLSELRKEIVATAPGNVRHADRVDALIREAGRLGAAEFAAGITPAVAEIIEGATVPAISGRAMVWGLGLAALLWGAIYAGARSIGLV